MTPMWPAGLIVLTYVPGMALFRLLYGHRAVRAALPAAERVLWQLALGALLTSAMGFALAWIGRFSLSHLLAADFVLVLLTLALFRGRLRLGTPPPADASRENRDSPASIVALLIVMVLAGWLFARPAEYLIGGKDPGVYVNEGAQIAQGGSLFIRDPVVAAVPPASANLFFPSHQNAYYYGLRFMGFFILDPRAGLIVGQFPHLYPIWIAIGFALGGVAGALAITPAFALLAVLAIYCVGRRLAGRFAGLAAALLLALNVVEIWFARYPNSEIPFQFFVLAGLLAASRAVEEEDPVFAVMGGLLLGATCFLRLDAALLLFGVGVTVFILPAMGVSWRTLAALLAPLAGLAAVSLWYLWRVLRPYSSYPEWFIRNRLGLFLGGLALAVAGAGLVIALAVRRRAATRAFVEQRLPILLAAIAVAAALYGYLWRPGHPGALIAIHDAMALRSFAWFVTPAGLAAALAGFVLLLRGRLRIAVFFLSTLLVYAAVFFYKLRIVPEYFWAARRFVPVILPGTILCMAVLLARLARVPDRGWRRVFGLTTTFALTAGLAVAFAWADRPVLFHTEDAGIRRFLEEFAASFGPRDLLIVESRNASDLHVLALPLAYAYGRPVLVLNSPRPEKATFRAFLDEAQRQYSRVFFAGGGGTDLVSKHVRVGPVRGYRFQVPEYESAWNAYPRAVRFKEFDFGLYRFEKGEAADRPFALDVGFEDDLYVFRFHAKERLGTVTFRWTRDVSFISLLGLRRDSREIVLRLNDGGRPASAGPARVLAFLADRPLGSFTVTPGFQEYRLPLTPALDELAVRSDEPLVLRLVSSTWVPRLVLGAPDDRQLGVMVDRIDVR